MKVQWPIIKISIILSKTKHFCQSDKQNDEHTYQRILNNLKRHVLSSFLKLYLQVLDVICQEILITMSVELTYIFLNFFKGGLWCQKIYYLMGKGFIRTLIMVLRFNPFSRSFWRGNERHC